MSNLIEFSLKTPHNGFYNITREVTEAIKESGLDSGIALVFCPHTTAAVTLTENTDPLVGEDLLREMVDKPGEYSALIREVQDMNGFTSLKEKVDRAKN